MLDTWQTSVNGPQYSLQATVQVIGNDVLIVVTGGDHPHIGAVTMVAANQPPQTVQYPSHDGRLHKDNFISERVAKKVQPWVPGSLTVTAGMHVDQISQAQLSAAGPLTDQLSANLVQFFERYQFAATAPKYYSNNQHPQ